MTVLYISCINIFLYESLLSGLIVKQPVEDHVGQHILTFFVTNTCGKYDTMILTISIQKLVCIRTKTFYAGINNLLKTYKNDCANKTKHMCKRTETLVIVY